MLCRLDLLFLHEAMLNFLESLVKLFNLDIYIYIYIYILFFLFFIFYFYFFYQGGRNLRNFAMKSLAIQIQPR